MDRLFNVIQDGERFVAVERAGELRRASLAAADIFGGYSLGAPVRGGLGAVTLLAPVRPSKIICVGLNYNDHAAEVHKPLPAEPLLFLKPSRAVIDPGSNRHEPTGGEYKQDEGNRNEILFHCANPLFRLIMPTL